MYFRYYKIIKKYIFKQMHDIKFIIKSVTKY